MVSTSLVTNLSRFLTTSRPKTGKKLLNMSDVEKGYHLQKQDGAL